MRNIVGQSVSGSDFFPRDLLIRKIRQRLENGNHLYLSAPRRVGKTSIMNHLREQDWEGWSFIYEITESVSSTDEFYKILSKKLLESDAIRTVSKFTDRFKKATEAILNHLSVSIELPFVKIESQGTDEISFGLEFERLLEEIDLGENKLVFLIDEFPKTIENIMERESKTEALRFLQLFRDLLHNPKIKDKVQFLLTGSIGLPPIVKKLDGLHLITMLNVLDVPPLSMKEGEMFLAKLLKNYQVAYDDNVLHFMLQKLDWLIPFHIQLAAQELIDVYESEEKTVTHTEAERAFEQILHHRNSMYFEIYRERLVKNFSQPDYKYADEVLKKIAINGSIDKLELSDLSVKFGVEDTWQATVESLTYDGFIHLESARKEYRFTSAILKLWWEKYVC